MLEAAQREENRSVLDLVLLNSVVKDLARIEVDVTSHGEAVLNGRLSKSQQKLIQMEQSKYNALTPSPSFSNCKSKPVSKSKSFKETCKGKTRPINKYRKTKTTDLHKISLGSSSSELSDEWQEVLQHCDDEEDDDDKEEVHMVMVPKRKTSFMQNVSSIFKNIR